MSGIFTFILLVSTYTWGFQAWAGIWECETRLRLTSQIRAPRHGIEPSRILEFKVQDFYYRITLAMRQPSAQVSPAVVQIFYSSYRNQKLEKLIENLLRSEFKVLIEDTDLGMFRRILTIDVNRADFESITKNISTALQRRFSSAAQIYPSIAPSARKVSAGVADAARMMSSFLVRRKVVASADEADRILNRAHARLIQRLSEHELRFFDYGIFDEVLPYERDLQMQAIAKEIADIVDPSDLFYEEIHEEIREKFIAIAKQILTQQHRSDMPRLEQVQSYLGMIVSLAQKLTGARSEDLTDEFTPVIQIPNLYSTTGFARLEQIASRPRLSVRDTAEVKAALTEAAFVRPDKPNEWWARHREVSSLFYYLSSLNDQLNYINQQVEFEISNEPTSTSGENIRMFSKLRIIAPSNGVDNDGSSFLNLGTDLPNSFTHQSRRLNSGPGNRKERFDYDTPEFD